MSSHNDVLLECRDNPGWSEWDVTRRQVAVCGRVTRDDGSPVAEGEVRIEPPPVRQTHVVRTRDDGTYFFLDLPGGEYTVTAEAGRGANGSGRGLVVWDASGEIKEAAVDIEVAPARPGPSRQPEVRDEVEENAGSALTKKKGSPRPRAGAGARRQH